MSFIEGMPVAASIRPMYNTGTLIDIPGGTYYFGKNGNSVLNGGISLINGIIGPQNSFKSAIAQELHLGLCNNYIGAKAIIYETEGSSGYHRIQKVAKRKPNLAHLEIDEYNTDRVVVSESQDILLDNFWELIKKHAAVRRNDKTIKNQETAFSDPNGKPVMVAAPIVVCIDSFSEATGEDNEKKFIDKAKVGSSETNMLYMAQGKVKAQIIAQSINLFARAGMIFMSVGHVGKEIQMDAYAPPPQKLSFARRGGKIKGITEKYESINNHLLEIFSGSKLINSSSDKSAKYPLNEFDRDDKTTDLMRIHAVHTRNKHGSSGASYTFIFSQTEGLQYELTDFYYLREEHDAYGFNGNKHNYELDLLPEVKLSRTTIRKKIKTDRRVGRALQITREMRQMYDYWPNLEEKYRCTPKELYDDIKKKGYDWDILLNTRGYWTFENTKYYHDPELSTLDLLRIRAGEYHPYWLGEDKKTVNWDKLDITTWSPDN